MAISDVVFDLADKELLDLLKQLRVKVMGEMKTGRRITSVSGDGQSVTYDLGGASPKVAYRVARNEAVRRGLLRRKPASGGIVNFNPGIKTDCECD